MLMATPLWSSPECLTFAGESLPELYEFEASRKVLQTVDEIVQASGLISERFDVRAANVGSAAAVICGDDRKLFYSANYFAGLESSGWAMRSILAHEVAHHLNGHTLKSNSEDREKMELEADYFAGYLVCRLGGTLQDAQKAYRRESGPGYPPLSARLERVAIGWTRALEDDLCPPEVSNVIEEESLTELSNALVIHGGNANEFANRSLVSAGHIFFEDVHFRAEEPMIFFADKISFDQSSTLQGKKLVLISRTVEGGTVSADGGAGENGGEVLLAALNVSGTSLTARGGDGKPGMNGSDGPNGRRGEDGTNGKCGAGMFGDCRGSSNGRDGTPGQPGKPGEPGQPGGNGGRIALLTFSQRAL